MNLRYIVSSFALTTVLAASSASALVPVRPVQPVPAPHTEESSPAAGASQEPAPATAPASAPAAAEPEPAASPAPAVAAPEASAPAISLPAPTPAPQLQATPIPIPTAPPEETYPLTAELLDGTVVVFGKDGAVTVKGSDHKERVPPDGILTLRDGTTFEVHGGVRVQQ